MTSAESRFGSASVVCSDHALPSSERNTRTTSVSATANCRPHGCIATARPNWGDASDGTAAGGSEYSSEKPDSNVDTRLQPQYSQSWHDMEQHSTQVTQSRCRDVRRTWSRPHDPARGQTPPTVTTHTHRKMENPAAPVPTASLTAPPVEQPSEDSDADTAVVPAGVAIATQRGLDHDDSEGNTGRSVAPHTDTAVAVGPTTATNRSLAARR
jgi:hypothetical protein